jgi:hypothetical protein
MNVYVNVTYMTVVLKVNIIEILSEMNVYVHVVVLHITYDCCS